MTLIFCPKLEISGNRPLLILLSLVAILTLILEKKITQLVAEKQFLSNFSLKKWNPETQNLLFIHVSKAGGTSLDKLLKPLAKSRDGVYQGSKHYDWGQVEENNHFSTKNSSFTLIQFRHPIDRTISNFYFAKTRNFTIGTKMRDQTIDEYFNDENSMLETYTIWLDGASAIWWLTGTHPASWVHPKRDPGKFLTKNMDPSIIVEAIHGGFAVTS